MDEAVELARRTLGHRFRQARVTAGLTQKQVHELTGIDIATISKIESIDWNPSISTLAKLAQAVGVPLSELFTDDAEASDG